MREDERLVGKVVALRNEILELKSASFANLQLRLAQLEAQLPVKNKLLFRKSSEKRPVEGLEAPVKAPQVGHGPRAHPALPVVEQLFAMDEANMGCPKCGKFIATFTGKFEASEEITVVVRRFVLVKQQRQKYRCAFNGCIETAPGSVKLFPGARHSVDFAVEVVAGKYSCGVHQSLAPSLPRSARSSASSASSTRPTFCVRRARPEAITAEWSGTRGPGWWWSESDPGRSEQR